jgi:hypothetical protein
VVGLRPHGIPETATLKEAFEPRAKALGVTWEQWQESLAIRTHPRRFSTLAELANAAVFMASDKASGMTGNDRQFDHGQPGRLAAKRPRICYGRGRIAPSI